MEIASRSEPPDLRPVMPRPGWGGGASMRQWRDFAVVNKPCGRFVPRDSCAPPGLDPRSGFLGVLVATLPPPQATRSARSAGKSVQLSQSPLRIRNYFKTLEQSLFQQSQVGLWRIETKKDKNGNFDAKTQKRKEKHKDIKI